MIHFCVSCDRLTSHLEINGVERQCIRCGTSVSCDYKTLRDEFAMHAMAALIAWYGDVGDVTKRSYKFADEMLKRRKEHDT